MEGRKYYFHFILKESEGFETLRNLPRPCSQGQKQDSDSGILSDPGTPALNTYGKCL